MIKNSAAGWALVVFSSFISIGCSRVPRAHESDYQGIVELDEWVLGFEVGGRVQTIPAVRGARVEAQQKLATLDPTLELTLRAARASDAQAAEAQLALLKAGTRGEEIRSVEAEVRAAKASEDLLSRNLVREKELRARNASTDAAVDDLQGRLDSAIGQRQSIEQRLAALRRGSRSEDLHAAEARLAAATSQVKLEDERIARHELAAPAKGTVLDVHVKAGEVVTPGAPVVTVSDPTHPYADVFVPEGKLNGVAVGVKATVHVDGEASGFSGVIETMGQKTEFTPRFLFSERERPNLVVRVRVRIQDPEDKLHAGVPAFVDFQTAGKS